MSQKKQFAGEIYNHYEHEVVAPEEIYGPNLGYVITGRLGKDHRNRGFDGRIIHTSLVVKRYTEGDGQFIETLNSIYQLV